MRVRRGWGLLLFNLISLFGVAKEPIDGSVSLVLAPGDAERIFHHVLDFHVHRPELPFPRLIAMEPGPLVLEQGLRLLPNEIPPGLSAPELLLVSASPDLKPSLMFLAFIRKCLALGGRVWIVGDRFPEALADLGLEPGSVIELVPVEGLKDRLAAAFPRENSAPPP